jgi:hypothetical protein
MLTRCSKMCRGNEEGPGSPCTSTQQFRLTSGTQSDEADPMRGLSSEQTGAGLARIWPTRLDTKLPSPFAEYGQSTANLEHSAALVRVRWHAEGPAPQTPPDSLVSTPRAGAEPRSHIVDAVRTTAAEQPLEVLLISSPAPGLTNAQLASKTTIDWPGAWSAHPGAPRSRLTPTAMVNINLQGPHTPPLLVCLRQSQAQAAAALQYVSLVGSLALSARLVT